MIQFLEKNVNPAVLQKKANPNSDQQKINQRFLFNIFQPYHSARGISLIRERSTVTKKGIPFYIWSVRSV